MITSLILSPGEIGKVRLVSGGDICIAQLYKTSLHVIYFNYFEFALSNPSQAKQCLDLLMTFVNNFKSA
jgi:hypothetical protein